MSRSLVPQRALGILSRCKRIRSSTYDADGNRVKGTVAGVTTVYIAGLYEYQNGATTKYYEGGALRRTGYASDNGVFYMVSDHLRSTSVLVNRDGTVKSRN